jgi:hypothetical protein
MGDKAIISDILEANRLTEHEQRMTPRLFLDE